MKSQEIYGLTMVKIPFNKDYWYLDTGIHYHCFGPRSQRFIYELNLDIGYGTTLSIFDPFTGTIKHRICLDNFFHRNFENMIYNPRSSELNNFLRRLKCGLILL